MKGETRVDLVVTYVVRIGWVEAEPMTDRIPVRLHALWGIEGMSTGEYLDASAVERLAALPGVDAEMQLLPEGDLRFGSREIAVAEAKRRARTSAPLEAARYATIRDRHLVLVFAWSGDRSRPDCTRALPSST